MKKNRYLAIIPLLMSAFMVTGCAEPISTENGLSEVYAAIEKVTSSDYRSEINSMVYYTKATYNEPFNVNDVTYTPAPEQGEEKAVSADFRVVTDEVLTRIDFSNPNDLYYYNFTTRTYKYLTSYDNKVGTAGYSDTIVRFGYQFYKNSKGKYQLDMMGSRGIEKAKSLKLDNYPYINASTELSNVESLISTGINTFDNENAKVLFDEFFTKIVEHNYRINKDKVDTFESDGTHGYQYLASDTSFEIHEAGNFEFEYKKPSISTFDVTISNIEIGELNEESGTVKVSVKFSNGSKYDMELEPSRIPENFGPDKYNEVSYVEPSTNEWIVFDIETKIKSTDTSVEGSNQFVLLNQSAGLDKNQDITEKFNVNRKFWAKTEVEKAEGERKVNMVYGNHGFLTSSYINDERSTKEFVLGGCEKYYSSYYTTADFNVKIPHVYA